jgi:hypothetical protein
VVGLMTPVDENLHEGEEDRFPVEAIPEEYL